MMSLIQLRDYDFRQACVRVIESFPQGERIFVDRVIEMALASPAPHYYCTYEYALRVLRLLRHGKLQMKRDRRHPQWVELSDRCARLEKKWGYSLPYALSHVLAEGKASRFFISPETARHIFYKRPIAFQPSLPL